jgi:hypothetical protein
VGVDQILKRFRANEGGVAAKDKDILILGAGTLRTEHRVAGPQLLILNHNIHPIRSQYPFDRISLMPYNNRTLVNAASPDRIEHVMNHRSEKDRVQHFGDGRFHTGTLAGGKDNGND